MLCVLAVQSVLATWDSCNFHHCKSRPCWSSRPACFIDIDNITERQMLDLAEPPRLWSHKMVLNPGRLPGGGHGSFQFLLGHREFGKFYFNNG